MCAFLLSFRSALSTEQLRSTICEFAVMSLALIVLTPSWANYVSDASIVAILSCTRQVSTPCTLFRGAKRSRMRPFRRIVVASGSL